jgi:hypothetical protein
VKLKMIYQFKNLPYIFLYVILTNGIITFFVEFSNRTKATLAFDYHWTERYYNFVEYLRINSEGKKITLKEVEDKYISDWWDKAIREV